MDREYFESRIENGKRNLDESNLAKSIVVTFLLWFAWFCIGRMAFVFYQLSEGIVRLINDTTGLSYLFATIITVIGFSLIIILIAKVFEGNVKRFFVKIGWVLKFFYEMFKFAHVKLFSFLFEKEQI